jgi:metal-sulfur cluster biosynthetic enzyme
MNPSPSSPTPSETASTQAASADAAQVLAALGRVYDPEVGENIVDLGLVYRIDCLSERIEIDVTMTTPACPASGVIAADAEAAVREACPQVDDIAVSVVFDPPWSPDRMSDALKRRFGW